MNLDNITTMTKTSDDLEFDKDGNATVEANLGHPNNASAQVLAYFDFNPEELAFIQFFCKETYDNGIGGEILESFINQIPANKLELPMEECASLEMIFLGMKFTPIIGDSMNQHVDLCDKIISTINYAIKNEQKSKRSVKPDPIKVIK